MKKNNIFTIIILSLIFILIYLASSFQINSIVDTGREFYIPFRMLKGEVLYKDIFNIYGPLSYQINCMAYMLFGTCINALKIFGSTFSFLILILSYLLSKELFEENQKFSKNIFWILPCFTGIFSFGIFNYTIPYAFSMSYGLCFFLASVLMFVKFLKNDKNIYLFSSFLFAGGAVSLKYEFYLYFIFLFVYGLFIQKVSFKRVLISLLFGILIPCLSFGTLFVQGMTSADLTKTFETVKTMATTKSIKFLYSYRAGTYFNLKIFAASLVKSLFFILFAGFWYLAEKFFKNEKVLYYTIITFVAGTLYYVGISGTAFFAVINFILLCCFYKKIFENKLVLFFMISSLILSIKTFFSININSYGTFTLPFVIMSILVFVNNINFTDKESLAGFAKTTTNVCASSVIFLCILANGSIFIEKINNKIETSNTNIKESFYDFSYIKKPMNELISYILQNTKQEDKIVILPESQFVNFLTKRPADNLYDSLTPMYFETFGEEQIIEHFEQTKPEYFVLNNRNTADYGKNFICKNYGRQFCIFVKENYEEIKEIGNPRFNMKIYKRKDTL